MDDRRDQSEPSRRPLEGSQQESGENRDELISSKNDEISRFSKDNKTSSTGPRIKSSINPPPRPGNTPSKITQKKSDHSDDKPSRKKGKDEREEGEGTPGRKGSIPEGMITRVVQWNMPTARQEQEVTHGEGEQEATRPRRVAAAKPTIQYNTRSNAQSRTGEVSSSGNELPAKPRAKKTTKKTLEEPATPHRDDYPENHYDEQRIQEARRMEGEPMERVQTPERGRSNEARRGTARQVTPRGSQRSRSVTPTSSRATTPNQNVEPYGENDNNNGPWYEVDSYKRMESRWLEQEVPQDYNQRMVEYEQARARVKYAHEMVNQARARGESEQNVRKLEEMLLMGTRAARKTSTVAPRKPPVNPRYTVNNNTVEDIICDSCEGYGHYANVCPSDRIVQPTTPRWNPLRRLDLNAPYSSNDEGNCVCHDEHPWEECPSNPEARKRRKDEKRNKKKRKDRERKKKLRAKDKQKKKKKDRKKEKKILKEKGKKGKRKRGCRDIDTSSSDSSDSDSDGTSKNPSSDDSSDDDSDSSDSWSSSDSDKDRFKIIRTNDRIPPVFSGDGEDVEQWHVKYTMCAKVNEWNNQDQLRQIPLLLQGTAFDWYQQWRKRHKNVSAKRTVKELVKAFKELEANSSLLARMYQERQASDEDPRQWYYRLISMNARVDHPLKERQLKVLFQRGLVKQLQDKVSLKDSVSMKKLMKKAMEQWSYRSKSRGERAPIAAFQKEPTKVPPCSIPPIPAAQTPTTPNTRKEKVQCTECGRTGHTENLCWKKHPELRPIRKSQNPTQAITVVQTDSNEEQLNESEEQA